MPDVLRRSSHCDLQKTHSKRKKKYEQWCARELCVCDPLVWDTHMRPLKHNSSFGKEAKVEKEPVEREERRNTLILLRE